jgi:hypothetical protein
MAEKFILSQTFWACKAENFLTQGCNKRETWTVNQMEEFWCFFILTSQAGKLLNQ